LQTLLTKFYTGLFWFVNNYCWSKSRNN